MTTIHELVEEAVAVIGDNFATSRRVTYLSFLGQALSRKGFKLTEILDGRKLAELLASEAADRVVVRPLPQDSKVLVAYPLGIELGKELDPFNISESSKVVAKPRRKRELLYDAVWKAFCNPIAEGFVRCFSLNPEPEWTDIPEGDGCAGYLIDREFVIDGTYPTKFDRYERVYASIQSWCQNHEIKFESLILQRQLPANRSRSVLQILLDNLSDDQLSRMNLPLDIVKHLSRN